MFRSADSETEALSLNYEWSMRQTAPFEILHICGPAYSGTCTQVDDSDARLAVCDRCGARISFTTLARLLRRSEAGGV